MKKYFHKKNILILLGITLVVTIVSIVYRPTKPLPNIISTYPSTNSTKASYFDPVRINFDQTINLSLISVKSVPEELWSVTSIEGVPTTAVLNHAQYFRVNTDYSLTIFYDNQQLGILKFKTGPQQSDPRYIQEVNNELALSYPLATKVPYENNIFKILYTTPLTLEITIKNPNLTSEEVIDEVKDWVTKNGANASVHKYVIASPSSAPTN